MSNHMPAALILDQLKKTYDNGHTALNGISLTVAEGDFFALLGRNGAGKSTAIGIISSLVNKSAGTVKIFDADIDQNFSLAKSYLGVVPQEFNFSVFETTEQIISNQAGYYGIPKGIAKERTERYLKQLGLWEKRGEPSRSLSGGMKRRLMIARALVHNPRLLILDEPTAGVDIEIRRSMWDFLTTINQQGTTIILTTHYLEEAESLCRNVAIIEKGDIVENTSTRSLLAKLQQESYVLDLAESIETLPDRLANDETRSWRMQGPQCLEVDIPKSQGINSVFDTLTQVGIQVTSMRNKTNRLEKLFLDMVNGE